MLAVVVGRVNLCKTPQLLINMRHYRPNSICGKTSGKGRANLKKICIVTQRNTRCSLVKNISQRKSGKRKNSDLVFSGHAE